MKKQAQTIRLSRETLVQLDGTHLKPVGGGVLTAAGPLCVTVAGGSCGHICP
jgi:hypothetical protein